MANKYLKAGSLYMIGNVFDKALAFLTVPIFTKLLSTSDYGMATTYLSWVSLLSVVITLSLGNSVRTAFVDFKSSIDKYISSVFVLGSLSAIAVSGVVILINIVFRFVDNWWLIVCCCVQSYAVSIIKTVDWKLIMELQYLKRTILQCVPNLIIILLSIFLILQFQTDKYFGKIYAYVLINSIVAVLLLVLFFKRGGCFFNKQYWCYALSFSIPIVFHSLSNVLLSQSDRIMITGYRGTSETGLYALAYQYGLIPLVIITTLENLWLPWFTDRMENRDYETINRISKHYIFVVALCCSAYMMICPELLRLMSANTFHEATSMTAPIVLSTFFMFMASLPLNMEYYHKKTGRIASNTLVAAISNVIFNLFFIPIYGAIAAAYTTAASYFLSFIMHYYVGRKIDKKFVSIGYYSGGLAVVLLATLIAQLFHRNISIRGSFLAVLCLIAFLYIRMNIKSLSFIFRKRDESAAI